jgi:hypothetical protein
MADLKAVVQHVPEFNSWNHAERIKFFAWFLHFHEKKERFTSQDIGRCFDLLSEPQPSSISPFLASMANKKPPEAMRDAKGNYQLVRTVREDFDKKYGKRAISIQVEQSLIDLPNQVPDLAEKDFLVEAIICYTQGAFRAAIVMTWNLAYHHLLNFIRTHHLAAFNAAYPLVLKGKHATAKVPVIAAYDDFAVDLKESEVIKIAKSANAITNDQFNLLEPKLKRRNSAAHPSSMKLGQLQAEEFIKDLVDNIILALKI